MKTTEIIERMDETINDHVENMQYADDDETEWRENCIEALDIAKKRLQSSVCPYNAVCLAEIENSCDGIEYSFTDEEKQQMSKELCERDYWAESLKESADDIVSDLINKKEITAGGL